MEEYTIEQIADDNYKFTQLLYQKSFGINHSISSIKIKYDTASFGHKNIGFFAVTPKGEPAAYYGVFPMVMTIDSKDVSVAQSGDTMTAPEHRGKGLFILLAKKTYQLAEEQGMKLVFGFPNENSFPGFQKKLDWQFFSTMKKFTLVNKVIPFCEIAGKYGFLNAFYRSYYHLRLSRFIIPLTKQSIAPFNVFKPYGFIKKDEDFFRYKMNNPDIQLIKIGHFSLLVKPKTHLFIGDVGYFKKHETDDFLKVLKGLARMLGSRKTILILSENHWLYDYLAAYIQPTENLPIGFLPFNQDVNLADITFTQADYDTF